MTQLVDGVRVNVFPLLTISWKMNFSTQYLIRDDCRSWVTGDRYNNRCWRLKSVVTYVTYSHNCLKLIHSIKITVQMSALKKGNPLRNTSLSQWLSHHIIYYNTIWSTLVQTEYDAYGVSILCCNHTVYWNYENIEIHFIYNFFNNTIY